MHYNNALMHLIMHYNNAPIMHLHLLKD